MSGAAAGCSEHERDQADPMTGGGGGPRAERPGNGAGEVKAVWNGCLGCADGVGTSQVNPHLAVRLNRGEVARLRGVSFAATAHVFEYAAWCPWSPNAWSRRRRFVGSHPVPPAVQLPHGFRGAQASDLGGIAASVLARVSRYACDIERV